MRKSLRYLWGLYILIGVVSCQKTDLEGPEPEYESTTVVYTTNTSKTVLEAYSFIHTGPCDIAPEEQIRTFFLQVDLAGNDTFFKEIQYFYGRKTQILAREFEPASIVSIDVIADSDYDAAHPKGSSLNDILELEYPDPKGPGQLRVDLDTYFATHAELTAWKFNLNAKTPPLQENEIEFHPAAELDYSLLGFGVTLQLTLADGSTLKITPLPSVMIASAQ